MLDLVIITLLKSTFSTAVAYTRNKWSVLIVILEFLQGAKREAAVTSFYTGV